MVIHTWKCLLSRLILCDSHTMESPERHRLKLTSQCHLLSGAAPLLLSVHGWNFSPAGRDLPVKPLSASGTMPFVFLEEGRSWAGNTPRHFHLHRQGDTRTDRGLLYIHMHTRKMYCISWYKLMKHITFAFARSTLVMEGKYFWNVFNQWLLESGGYTLLILESVCVCLGNGSITYGNYLYSCQIIAISVLLLSRTAKSKKNTNQIRKSEVSRCCGLIIRFGFNLVGKHWGDCDLSAYFSEISILWPQVFSLTVHSLVMDSA